jgi:hypothetical protein
MMRRKTAAEYLDLSETAFEREIIAGRMPASVSFGGRELWCKDAIDRALDRISGGVIEADYRRRTRERYGEAA